MALVEDVRKAIDVQKLSTNDILSHYVTRTFSYFGCL